MEARFRIRAAGGREFTLGTLDAFVRRVQAGDITPYDLVFDVLTGQWAPARSHPAYLLSVDPLVESREGSEASVPDGEAPADDVPESGDGESPAMDLVEVEEPSPESEKRAFIAQMEEERRLDLDPDHAPLESEVPLVDSRVGMVNEITAPSEDDHASEVEQVDEPESTPVEKRLPPPVERRARRVAPPSHHWGSWAGFSALLCVGLAGTATVAWAALRAGGPLPLVPATVQGARRAPRAIVPAEAPVRAGAYEGFMHAVDSIRTSLQLGAVPEAWLQGRYLADPSAYPQVRDYWDRMATFVETVHSNESEMYRDSYLAAAARGGVSGSMLSLRMAGATGDFEALQPERDSLYARIWDLATAAIGLDRTLVALQGRVVYEPVSGPHVSKDPVIQAVGTDPDARARLGVALDRVVAAMRPLQNGQVTAAGAKARVPMWLENGLRALGVGVE